MTEKKNSPPDETFAGWDHLKDATDRLPPKARCLLLQILGLLSDECLFKSLEKECPDIAEEVRMTLETILHVNLQKHYSEIQTHKGKLDTLNYVRAFTKNLIASVKEEPFDIDSLASYFESALSEGLYLATTTACHPGIHAKELELPETDEWCTPLEEGTPLFDSRFIAEYFALDARNTCGGEPLVLNVGPRALRIPINIEVGRILEEPHCIFQAGVMMYSDHPIPPKLVKGWYVVPNPSAMQAVVALRGRARLWLKEADG